MSEGARASEAGSSGRGAVFSILASRFTYSINWYTTATPALSLIALQYAVPGAFIGLIPSIFLLGVGVFQLPAGALSSKYGSKPVALGGLLLLSVSSIATPFAPNFTVLLALRFFAGAGAAVFFSPAIGVLSSFSSKEGRTGVIGLYNAAFSLGAGLALLLWPTLVRETSWQTGVLLGGVLSLASFMYSLFAVDMKRAVEKPVTGVTREEIFSVIRNGQVWIIALGLVGTWGVYNALPQFMFGYATEYLGLPPDSIIAPAMASIILFVGLVGGLLSGPLHRNIRNARTLLVLISSLFALSLPLFMLRSVPAALAGSAAVGILFTAGVTITYALPAHMQSVGLKNIPLAISLVNSIQVLGGFWVATLFSYVLYHLGYYWTFPVMVAVSAVFLPIYVFKMRRVD